MSAPAISRLERGLRHPRPDVVTLLAEALGLSAEDRRTLLESSGSSPAGGRSTPDEEDGAVGPEAADPTSAAPLDVPLAADLAAARTTVRSITELATALDHTLHLLYPSPQRAQQLRDVRTGDGYHLLSGAEQTLLARLSVFPGAFTRRSAAAVATVSASSPDTVDALDLLIARSLVVPAEQRDGDTAFTLLPGVRVAATQRLATQPDCSDTQRRFAHFFRDLAAEAAPQLSGDQQQVWWLRLDADADNLRSAFDWCLEHEPLSALELVTSLWRWWRLRGCYAEGRAWAEAALAHNRVAPPWLRAPALGAAGLLTLLQGDYEAAQAKIQAGLDAYASGGDDAGVGWCLALLGAVAHERGEYTVATQLHERSLVLARRADDLHAVARQLNFLAQVSWLRGDLDHSQHLGQSALDLASSTGDQLGVIASLLNLGLTARQAGRLSRADDLLGHALTLSRRVDDHEGIAWSLEQLAVVRRLRREHQAAEHHLSASLAAYRRLGRRWRVASVLDELAAVAVATGAPDRAWAQLEAATQLRREIGTAQPASERSTREDTLSSARAMLGPETSASTWTRMAMSEA